MLPTCYTAGLERRRFRVCGFDLVPFTLGHARWLYVANSPYITDEKKAADAGDLLMASAICSRPILHDLKEAETLVAQSARAHVGELENEHAKMLEYVAYYATPHPVKRAPDVEPHDMAIPWPWMLAGFLQMQCGEREPWSAIVSDALWLWATYCDMTGKVRLLTLDEMQAAELLKEAKHG